MTVDATSAGQPNDLAEQVARLREQVEALMSERDPSAPAGAAACPAEGVACNAVEALKRNAEAVSGQIREQPLLALLIAAGMGFVLGRAGR